MSVTEYIIPGMLIRDHQACVPLDWTTPEGTTIDIFAREICDPMRRRDRLPLLAFLQGGPGGKSPRPSNGGPAWLTEALKTHRVILIDQRGTGRSTRIETATMSAFPSGEAAADYLCHFRADSIVSDCEHLRKTLFGNARWETLGQSYGGFLTLTYLSQAPEGLSACYITGGLAGIAATADDVYRRTYPRVMEKNAHYYRRYPQDRALIGSIADFIDSNDVRLPDGDRLSVRRLQTVGIDFGMAPGYENIHWLMDEAFSGAKKDRLSDGFLASVAALTSFDGNPLFALLQESIYGQGDGATAWAAHRVREEHPQFDSTARPLLMTGEMMYPWMFEEIRSLRPFRAAAEALAARPHHTALYNPAALAANGVPVAAAVYHDDMYVDAQLSLETAAAVGNIDVWVTNEYEHDGLRQSASVLRRLITMVRNGGGALSAEQP